MDASSSSAPAGERGNLNGNVGIQYPYEVKFGGNRENYGSSWPLWKDWEWEHEKWIDENFTDDVNLDNLNEELDDTAEPSSDLIVPLLRYQKEWLAWALKQEESPNKGGILADEMGMGKTVQAIALVLAKRELNRSTGSGLNSPSTSAGPSTGLPEVRATLVVCPFAAVSQWAGEIDSVTSAGSTKVLLYHGGSRSGSLEQFKEYDFVITTYSLLVDGYWIIKPLKVKCPHCKRPLHKDNLSQHYNCRRNAVKTAEQSQKLAPATDVFRYLKDEKIDAGESPLHSVRWNRIILDEAHLVNYKHSDTAKAVFALDSLYKWGLSGTLLQNNGNNLYSVIHFLRIVPYSYFFYPNCACRTIDHRGYDRPCDCSERCFKQFSWWERVIGKPLQGEDAIKRNRTMILLKHEILRSILMRRTKMGRAADLALPPCTVTVRRDPLDSREKEFYVTLHNESRSEFMKYVQAGTVMNNYMRIFHLLWRLCEAVDHPYLVVYPEAAVKRSKNAVAAENAEQVCGMCQDPIEDPVVMQSLCKACLLEFSAFTGQSYSPQCSEPITVDLSTRPDVEDQPKKTNVKGFKASSILNRISLEEFQTSTKIKALKQEIMMMIQRDGSAKGIVLSQFPSFLDLINFSLQESGISCVQLGEEDMSISARDASIKKFTEDPDCRIFLMFLRAGGLPIDPAVASHVFMMDRWWNPAVLWQAQDRIHRTGQFKPIRIMRFIIKNTIEERTHELAEKKRITEGDAGGSSDAPLQLTSKLLKEEYGYTNVGREGS